MTPERYARIKEIFAAARERPEAQRAAFLHDTCDGDAELRAEVAARLAEGDGDTLLSPAAELLASREYRAGDTIGQYRVEGKLGEGGMGVVYKARDTRLNRMVAIKRSNAQFSGRFEREARAVAALNHPHICTLYEVGPDYLVMEYVEGKPLSGPLPQDEAMRLAGQLLDALAAAHAKGIVHRDLKPANILVTKAGVKVLDFGLAKMSASALPADAPTETATQAGAILGTLQYMSPEQVQGKEVDARGDIFSFGMVLYEMLTGKRAFEGENSASVIAGILEREAPAVESEELNRVVKACLAKDPDERFQSARDVKRAIEWGANAPRRAERPIWLAWGVAALAVGLASLSFMHSRDQKAAPAAWLTMDLAPAESLGGNGHPVQTEMAFSPDGNTLVFSGSRGSGADARTELYKRAFDQPEAVPIPGSENGVGPFFSPDGKWVGFVAAGKLKKIAMSGGPGVNLCDGNGIWGATWGSDGMIVFAIANSGVLMQVSADGGTPRSLAEPDRSKGELFTSPEFLPDGRTLLFTARTSNDWGESQIEVRRPEGGVPRVIVKGGTNARYVQTGHLLYMNNAVLMAVPFDSRRLERTGTPVALLDGVRQAVNMTNDGLESGMAQFAISHSGNLVYAPGGIHPPHTGALVRVDRKGAISELNLPKGSYAALRLSPDGQRLATGLRPETSRLSDIWTYDLLRGTSSRLTSDGRNRWPLWTQDGRRILFEGGPPGQRQILSIMADGQGPTESLVTSKSEVDPTSWSPDGKWLAYLDNQKVWVRPPSGQGEPKLFLGSKFVFHDAQFSPDGKWMAYSANESGGIEVYAQAFPGPGERVHISTDGGYDPAWAPDGRQLFYISSKTQAMMVVDIASGSPLRVDRPRKLFELGWNFGCTPRCYDVYPDGQSFIMSRPDTLVDMPATRLNVVLNFVDELQRRAPRMPESHP
jgi:Tol biopolymer transport system component/predicted Ser/Thr protein kinase